MKYLIGIDLGTSGTKTVLFDLEGNIVASQSAEYPMSQPKNGWAEQNPDDWVSAGISTLRAVSSAVDPSDILGIGISGQMHGLVMLDAAGEVIRPSIIWCDQRTGAECAEIEARVGHDRLLSITANPALTGFTASKILWVRNHEPENYARCRHILLPKDYLRYKLTGVFATEVSDGSGMQLMDIGRRCWSEKVCAALEIDGELLARMYESPEITGSVTAEAAALTGLRAGTPVAGGAGDNAAAAVGTGVVRTGRAFTTIGTSGVVFAHTDRMELDPLGRVHTFCCAVPGCWQVMGVTQAAGLSLRWFRDEFCCGERDAASMLGTDPYDIMTQEAALSPIGANRLLYLPYLMGERTPHLDPDCRGAFIGLSASHTRRDLIRAVLEGVSYSLRDCMEIIRGMGVPVDDMTACGGGGSSAFWRRMLADLYGCPVAVSSSKESAAIGAAILAGVGAGAYPDVPSACDRLLSKKLVEQPNPEASAAYEPYYQLYRTLYAALREPNRALAAL